MKLRQLDEKDLPSLSAEQISHIVFDVPPAAVAAAGDAPAAAALLLGANPREAENRAGAAARHFHEGRFPIVVPTGAVRHETRLGEMTEAEFMARILLEGGVPEDAIVVENQAATTRENMLFGMAAIERALKPRGPSFDICVVTSAHHLRRSLALARLYLPRTARILGCAAEGAGGGRDEWMRDAFWTGKVMAELRYIKGMADHGEIEDIFF